MNLDFWINKRIFITGHTGFKGSWLCRILKNVGADVTGYSLTPPTNPNLFAICDPIMYMHSVIGDIRDAEGLQRVFMRAEPDFVLHMAAQPLVIDGYNAPAKTYETNVMGTVNILECLRKSGTVKSFLNVTTDKVYQNREWEWGYREIDVLNGFDPYSNSKSCSELVTSAYKNSFFTDTHTAISTARSGNVIGGGDFARNRILPDCVRAARRNEKIAVRNPNSIRPYQHVLEPLFAYLMILQKQYQDSSYAGNYNVGPNEQDCVTTGRLAEMFCKEWGNEQKWESKSTDGPHEAGFLKLDCSRLKCIGWQPVWDIETAIKHTVKWEKAYSANQDVCGVMDSSIFEYIQAHHKKFKIESGC